MFPHLRRFQFDQRARREKGFRYFAPQIYSLHEEESTGGVQDLRRGHGPPESNCIFFFRRLGRIVENLVYVYLRKQNDNVYYKATGGEIDFVINC